MLYSTYCVFALHATTALFFFNTRKNRRLRRKWHKHFSNRRRTIFPGSVQIPIGCCYQLSLFDMTLRKLPPVLWANLLALDACRPPMLFLRCPEPLSVFWFFSSSSSAATSVSARSFGAPFLAVTPVSASVKTPVAPQFRQLKLLCSSSTATATTATTNDRRSPLIKSLLIVNGH